MDKRVAILFLIFIFRFNDIFVRIKGPRAGLYEAFINFLFALVKINIFLYVWNKIIQGKKIFFYHFYPCENKFYGKRKN